MVNNNNKTTSALYQDLIKSGLEEEIIREANIQPATESNLEKYKIHWFDRKRRQKRFNPLYIIPYHVLETDKGKFCRVKVQSLSEYPFFTGKYTQPPKQVLENTCHLYILPSELEKMKSPKCKIAIVEGEKKALKLIQELRKIEGELGYKVAVIGIAGINNWQTAPEWKLIPIREKEFITFFDADSEYNTAVIKAELELAGFLYSKGAGSVKSAVWSVSEGKGIDDFFVNAKDKQLEKLKNLLSSTISVFEKYKDRLQDKEVLREFFKYPVRSEKTRLEYLVELIREKVRIKKKTIESVIRILKVEYEEELKERLQKRLKEVFGIENINIPSGFLLENGYLKDDKGQIITKFFIVSKKIVNENDELVSLKLKFIDREFLISIEELNKKSLTLVFNKNRIGMDEKTATKVLEYITQYQNVNNVEEEKIVFRVGWINDEYYLPQLREEAFSDELLDFEASGEKEKELGLLKKLFEEGSHLALGYVLGFASTLIKPLNLSNFVVFNQGLTGRGKTTLNLIGLSVFGNSERLIKNMNTTETGLELFLNTRKDVLNVLDEVNTGSKDVVKQITKIIYDFESGKGRTRAKRNLTLRETAQYRGILSITSEDSLNNLLRKADKTVKGALRRTVIIDYTEFENISKDLTLEVYERIDKNYGNLIGDWIEYVKGNIDEVKRVYRMWLWELQNEDRGFSFNGQERHLALLFATNEVIGRVFNIDINKVSEYIWQITEYNHFEFAEETQITPDRLKAKIEQFISETAQFFEYVEVDEKNMVVVEKNIPKKIYGKIEDNYIYLSSLGLKELSSYIGLPEKEIKKLLAEFGFSEKDETRIIKRTTKRIAGTSVHVYQIDLLNQ